MKRLLGCTLILLIFSSCTHTPVQRSTQKPTYNSENDFLDGLPAQPRPRAGTQDISSINRQNVVFAYEAPFGFHEYPVNSCQLGIEPCENKILVQIRFKLTCRAGTGTEQNILYHSTQPPLSFRQIRWELGSLRGQIQTDGEGVGEILLLADRSYPNNRLRLAQGNEFLYTRVREISQIITPEPWCH